MYQLEEVYGTYTKYQFGEPLNQMEDLACIKLEKN